MSAPFAIFPGSAGGVTRTPQRSFTSTDATASSALQMTGRPGIDSANDTYSDVLITRWNAGRVHRITGVTDHTLYFKALATPGQQALNAQNVVSVYVNGVFNQNITITDGPVIAQEYYVSQLGGGSKTVELWEGFQGADGTTLDNGSDRHFYSSYVTAVAVPAGATMTKPTATVGIIVIGESISQGGTGNSPWLPNGWCGQLRLLVHAQGQLLAFTSYSTLLGDGRTAAQRGDDIVALAQAMGVTTLKIIVLPRPNDYAYYGGVGAVNTTPAQLVAGYGTVLDTVRAAYPTCVVDFTYQIPAGSAVSVDHGGGDITAYWTALAGITTGRNWVTLHDLSGVLSLGTDYSEAANNQVHPNAAGQTKLLTAIRAYANINL